VDHIFVPEIISAVSYYDRPEDLRDMAENVDQTFRELKTQFISLQVKMNQLSDTFDKRFDALSDKSDARFMALMAALGQLNESKND
jgi:acyl-homoserine lactone acylase PvdQ